MDFKGQHSYAGAQTNDYTVPTPENSRIRDGVTSTEQVLSAIHEEIGQLEKRLETILRPMPPQAVSNTTTAVPAGPPCSHVAGRLNILNEGFRHAIDRLRELTSRVEV